jgi:hypothetical protein
VVYVTGTQFLWAESGCMFHPHGEQVASGRQIEVAGHFGSMQVLLAESGME